MGFMSKQWINRGQGLRNRRYSPDEVTVRAEEPTDGWSLTNDVIVEFVARRPNAEYQTLHLSAAEVNSAAPVIWNSCSADVRRKLVLVALTEMSDQELLRLLAQDLKLRLKDQKGK